MEIAVSIVMYFNKCLLVFINKKKKFTVSMKFTKIHTISIERILKKISNVVTKRERRIRTHRISFTWFFRSWKKNAPVDPLAGMETLRKTGPRQRCTGIAVPQVRLLPESLYSSCIFHNCSWL
jgi:hypothetical protein